MQLQDCPIWLQDLAVSCHSLGNCHAYYCKLPRDSKVPSILWPYHRGNHPRRASGENTLSIIDPEYQKEDYKHFSILQITSRYAWHDHHEYSSSMVWPLKIQILENCDAKVVTNWLESGLENVSKILSLWLQEAAAWKTIQRIIGTLLGGTLGYLIMLRASIHSRGSAVLALVCASLFVVLQGLTTSFTYTFLLACITLCSLTLCQDGVQRT